MQLDLADDAIDMGNGTGKVDVRHGGQQTGGHTLPRCMGDA